MFVKVDTLIMDAFNIQHVISRFVWFRQYGESFLLEHRECCFDVRRVDELSVLVDILLKFDNSVFRCEFSSLPVEKFVCVVTGIANKRALLCSVDVYFTANSHRFNECVRGATEDAYARIIRFEILIFFQWTVFLFEELVWKSVVDVDCLVPCK